MPRIGKHARAVLGRLLGIDDGRYDRLARAGALGPAAPGHGGGA